MAQDKKENGLLIGIVIGSSIATVATLLFTPRNGKENRQVLKKTAQALPEIAEDLSSSLQMNRQRLSQSAWQKWEQTLNRLQVAITAGVEASQQEIKSEEREQ